MKYWARTVPPLVQEKGYFETTAELMEWMDSILGRSSIYVAKPEDHLVIIKVDTDINPQVEKVFGEAKEEKKTPKKRRLPHLRKPFSRPKSKNK